MASKLIILGSSNAIPTTGSDNTMLSIITENSRVLIDSGINPIVKLDEAGLDINAFDDIIITHFHPDHITKSAIVTP